MVQWIQRPDRPETNRTPSVQGPIITSWQYSLKQQQEHESNMIFFPLRRPHLKQNQQDVMCAYCKYLYLKRGLLHNRENVNTEGDPVGGESCEGSSRELGNHHREPLLGAH